MSKDKLTDYSATAASNTDIGGISIAEGMLPSNVNNALREQMSHLADFAAGTSGVDVLKLQDDTDTNSIKIQAPASVTTTTTFTLPDGDGSANQSLVTNGSGTLSFSTRLANVVEDTTPQLGGNLDLNSSDITGTGNVSITGTVTADGLTVDTDTLYVDSTNNRVGIGTTSPTTNLTIQSSGANGLSLYQNGSDGARLFFVNNNASQGCGINNTSGNLAFYVGGSIPNSSTGTERMRIDSSGNVGIGTSSPSYPLTITSASNASALAINGRSSDNLGVAYWFANNGTTAYGDIRASASEFRISSTPASAVQTFYTNGSERMRIGSDGHLYATCNDGSLSNLTLRNGASGDAPDFLQCRDSANNLEMKVEPDGDVYNANGTYGTISDQKLKENITDASSQWDDIKALRLRKYNLIGNEKVHIGVVAQELEAAGMSGLVSESVDFDEDGNDLGTTTKSVKYSILHTKALKALQEAMERIETLESTIASLESRLSALEAN